MKTYTIEDMANADSDKNDGQLFEKEIAEMSEKVEVDT